MSEWSNYKLDELGSVGRGKSRHRPRNAPHLYGGEYPFIQTGDVKKANMYISEFTQTYSDAGLAQSKLWDKGTLLITIAANIADVAILDIDACFPDSVIGFIPNKEICDVKYIKYYFDLFQKTFQQISQGSTQDNLSVEKLLSLKIPAPPLPTQQKIAKILSNYDDLIENNLKRIKLLEESARLTYEEWFLRFRIDGKKLDINPETKLPFGWIQGSLGGLVRFHGGYAFKSKDYEENQKYKIVTIKNVQDGYFKPSTTDTISTVPDNIKLNQKLNNGDYIMSLTGNVGRACLVYGENYLLNQRVVKLEPKKSIDYSFLYSLFRHKNMLTQLENISNGAAQQNLSPVNAAKIKLPIPDEVSREKFNNKITTFSTN